MSVDPDAVFFGFLAVCFLAFVALAWRLARKPGTKAEEDPRTHPRDWVTPDIHADVPLRDLPAPTGLVERVERILDILQDSRSRGHGARIEAATEALQELRRGLGGGEATEGRP